MSLILGSNTSPFNASDFQKQEVERVAEEYKKIQAQLAEIERTKQHQMQLLDMQGTQTRKKSSTFTGLFKKLRSKTTSSSSSSSLSSSPSQSSLINYSQPTTATSPTNVNPARKSLKISIFPSHNDDNDLIEISHSRFEKVEATGAASLIQRVERVTPVVEERLTQFEFDEVNHFDPLEVQQINDMLNQYAYHDETLEDDSSVDEEEGQTLSKSANASTSPLSALKKYKQETIASNSSLSSLSPISTSPPTQSSLNDRVRSSSAKNEDTSEKRKSLFKPKKPISNEVIQQLATTNSILKDAYAKKNSHNVILLERKRYQESGCFSPKIILSKLKQENKLSQQFLIVDHYFEKNKPINFI